MAGFETRELEIASIVVLGSFNPSIFQPYWLAKYSLVPESEAAAAAITVIAPDVNIVKVGPFTLQIERERAVFEVADISYQAPLQDLLTGLVELLPHVPVHAVGFNRQMHFRTGGKDDLDRLGFLLAPTAPWEGILEGPEVRTLITWGRRGDVDARVQVQVEPSLKVLNALAVSVNEEHRLTTDNTLIGAGRLINAHYASAMTHSLAIGSKLAVKTKSAP
jgi:hypothetical protein